MDVFHIFLFILIQSVYFARNVHTVDIILIYSRGSRDLTQVQIKRSTTRQIFRVHLDAKSNSDCRNLETDMNSVKMKYRKIQIQLV